MALFQIIPLLASFPVPLPFFFGFALVGVGLTVLWVWMLVDCAVNEPSDGNEKIIWILVIVLTHWIGALIYLLVRRPERLRRFGK